MQPLVLAFVLLGLMLASSVVSIQANELDARSSTDPGIGCDAITNLSNTHAARVSFAILFPHWDSVPIFFWLHERDHQSASIDLMVTHYCSRYFGWGAGYAIPWLMTCIAYIESRWDPSAYNPSGATGLWQIMVPLACSACLHPDLLHSSS